MKIIFATANKGKLSEAQSILGEGFELVTPADLGITEDIPETGETLEENSMMKAMYLYERTGLDCFADDTGLEVEALGGAPGVHSARYATDGHDFKANMDKLLGELDKADAAAGHPVDRKARFRSVVTLLVNGEPHIFEGVFNGKIARSQSGTHGFGYDPVFIADVCPDRTVAEMPDEFKNENSHRGKALRAMAEWLKSE